MDPLVSAEVQVSQDQTRQAHDVLKQRLRLADQGQDAAVVRGIAVQISQGPERAASGSKPLLIATLADVDDALEHRLAGACVAQLAVRLAA